MSLERLKVFYGRWGKKLALEVCEMLDIEPGKSETFKFNNQNSFVRVEDNVRDIDCFIIHSIGENVNDDLMEMLIMVDALKRASARRVTAVMPYYFYARSDKKDQPRISITARLVADLLTAAGADRVITIDLHAEQIMGFFTRPVDQLLALPVICDHFHSLHLKNLVVVSPDAGGAKRARSFSWALKADLAIIDKRRLGNKDSTSVYGLIGDVKGKTAILVDDEIDTGGSIINSMGALKEAGAVKVYAACTHAVFSANAIESLTNSDLEQVVVTNSIPLKKTCDPSRIKVLSIGRLLAKAIRRIHEGTSVSALFSKYSQP
jgi:ribose-phosphate pyrophosphokinase